MILENAANPPVPRGHRINNDYYERKNCGGKDKGYAARNLFVLSSVLGGWQ